MTNHIQLNIMRVKLKNQRRINNIYNTYNILDL